MVGYAVHHIINAELRFIVAGIFKVRFVKGFDKGIGAGQGECVALP